jgi:hypothetical protein
MESHASCRRELIRTLGPVLMPPSCDMASLRDPRWTERHLALCAQNRREQDVLLAELIDAGKSPDPPPDWVP